MEIKRQFCYEHNVELDEVIEGIIRRLRLWLDDDCIVQVDEVDNLLEFVSDFLPKEVYPWRISVIQNNLYRVIQRLTSKDLWRKDF